MASGGRLPHSAPSLPLHPTPSGTTDSLRTPDTSTLFMSSLGNNQSSRAVDFTSLEDLLNFTGITHHTPSSSPSLETLAQDMELTQDPTLIGPPEAKRLRTSITPTTTNTPQSSLLSTHSSPLLTHSSLLPTHSSLLPAHSSLLPAHSPLLTTHSSPLPPNIRVSPLPSSTAQSRPCSNQPSSWSSKAAIPSLFPASSLSTTSVASVTTGVPNSTTHVPSVTTSAQHSTRVPTRLPLATTGIPACTSSPTTYNSMPSLVCGLALTTSSLRIPNPTKGVVTTPSLATTIPTSHSQSPAPISSPVVLGLAAHSTAHTQQVFSNLVSVATSSVLSSVSTTNSVSSTALHARNMFSNSSASSALSSFASQYPSTSHSAAGQYPSTSHSAAGQYPSTSHSAASQYPSTSLSAASQYPSTSLSPAGLYPSPSLSAAGQYPSTSLSAAGQYPSTSHSAAGQYPSTSHSAASQYPSTSLSAASLYPSTSLSAASQYPSTSLSAASLYPSTSLSAASQYPSTSHSAASQYPSTSLSAASQYPSTSLSAASQYPSTSLSAASQYPSTSLSADSQLATGNPRTSSLPSSLHASSPSPVPSSLSPPTCPKPPLSDPMTLPSHSPVGIQSSSLSLPSHPAQRALLVQLVQAYRQCTALGDTQGQARVRAQLNILLQAQKVGGATASLLSHTVVRNTSPHPPLSSPSSVSHHTPTSFTSTQVNHTPQLKTNNFMKPPLTTSSLPSFLTSQTPPLTPSLLASTSKANSLSVSMGTRAQSSLSTAPALSVVACSVSTSSPDHTITAVTPITSTHSRASPSGPASALKAAALYNLRLRQLQLFLQSLPEEQRPHSIPELKALLQRSGGHLSALAQTASSVGPSPPVSSATYLPAATTPSSLTAVTMPMVVPTLLASATKQPTLAQPILPSTTGQSASQPTVGQCLPLLTRGLPQLTPGTQLRVTSQSFLPTANQPVSAAKPSTTGVLSSDALTILASGSVPQAATPVSLLGNHHPQPASRPASDVPAGVAATTGRPSTATETTLSATALPPLKTGAPQLTTSVLPSTTAPPALPQTTPTAPPTTASSGHNEPIKPGVPTPLPPGVNPETLAVLCRMPDAELQKLNLPVALTTAIRVWRGQHSTGSQRGRKPAAHQNAGLPVVIPPQGSQLPSSLSPPSSASGAAHSTLQAAVQVSSPASQLIIIPPSDSFPGRSMNTISPVVSSQPHVTNTAPPPAPSSASLTLPSLPSRSFPPSRPITRHQVRTEQNKAEKERAAALTKVLQSSSEARIAYRFNMLRDKMTTQLMSPDSHTPFKSLHDVIARLLPYHMWSEAEPPPGAIEKADAVYESVAHVLMSHSQGLMSHYQHLIYHDAQRDSEALMSVCLERCFLESEKERKELEMQESQQAAQIAADLSLIAGALDDGDTTLTFGADFTLGDVMNSDPMLTFEPGIT